MKKRIEFSQRVFTRTRAYFIDAVRTPSGHLSMQITEREYQENYKAAKRWSITVYPENFGIFTEALAKVAEFIGSQNEK